MKKIQVLVFAVVAALSFSCSSDDSSSSNDDMYLKFKVNGESVNIVDPVTAWSASVSVSGSKGTGEAFRSLNLNMPVNLTVGEHAITGSFFDDSEYSAGYTHGDISTDSVEGTINITSIGGEYMQGTFSFTAANDEGDTFTITEGTFRAYTPEDTED